VPDEASGRLIGGLTPRPRARRSHLPRAFSFLASVSESMTALDQFLIILLNGLSYGLLLFMLSSGLTLIFSMMGVLNFAHASFYMLGAYFGYTLSGVGLLGRAGAGAAAGGRRWARCSSAWCLRRCTSSAMCRAAGHLRPVVRAAGAGATGLGPHRWTSAAAGAAGPGLHAGAVVGRGQACVLVGRRARGLCKGGRRACAVLAVPADARLHGRVALVMLLGGVAAAHAHPHRPGDPGRADAPGDGPNRWATTCRACSCWCSAPAARWRAGRRDRRQHLRHRAVMAAGRADHLRGGRGRRHGSLAGAFVGRC
jgi:hypothetical protein